MGCSTPLGGGDEMRVTIHGPGTRVKSRGEFKSEGHKAGNLWSQEVKTNTRPNPPPPMAALMCETRQVSGFQNLHNSPCRNPVLLLSPLIHRQSLSLPTRVKDYTVIHAVSLGVGSTLLCYHRLGA